MQHTRRVSLICVEPLDENQLRVRSCERVRDLWQKVGKIDVQDAALQRLLTTEDP